jgi:hypothetical protein
VFRRHAKFPFSYSMDLLRGKAWLRQGNNKEMKKGACAASVTFSSILGDNNPSDRDDGHTPRTTGGEMTDVFQPSSILYRARSAHHLRLSDRCGGIATDADVEALNLLPNVFAELGDRKACSEKPLYQTTFERQAEARRQHLRGGSRTR